MNKIRTYCILFLSLLSLAGCTEKKHSEKQVQTIKRLPDNLFIVPTHIKGFEPGYSFRRKELLVSFDRDTQYYYVSRNGIQDCFDYQFYYYYDNSNYIFKIRSFGSGENLKSCFIRWLNDYGVHKNFNLHNEIYTNIDSSTIRSLYPQYKGKVIFETMDSVNFKEDLQSSILNIYGNVGSIWISSPSIWDRRALRFQGEKK